MINPPTRELIDVIQKARLAEAERMRAGRPERGHERMIRTWRFGNYRIVLTHNRYHTTPRLV